MQTGRWLILCLSTIMCALAQPDLVLVNDNRKLVQVASFGFLPGGQLLLEVADFKVSVPDEPGSVAFYIRKGTALQDNDPNPKPNHQGNHWTCLLDQGSVKDEIDDGTGVVYEINGTTWQATMTVGAAEEGLWQVLLINCKPESTISLRLKVDQVNPGNNHLSAGDMPLPLVYRISAIGYFFVGLYWLRLLLRKDTKVIRAHWLMLLLVICIDINKVLQSVKYHYKMTGVLSEGWTFGFYIFASIDVLVSCYIFFCNSLKGFLSILIIVLLASGWMFIKPFLSVKDKRVISIVIPLQVLANIASAISDEAAVGSMDRSFWKTLLPIMDLAACVMVLWTIIQTRKHLSAASSADGKEVDVLSKYKLWSSFYIVTFVYIYVTRIVVQLLHSSLSFRYVTWVGVAVDEIATILFCIYIGYKFRPYPDNPYTQVPDDMEFDADEEATFQNERQDGGLRLLSMARRQETRALDSRHHSETRVA